MSTLRSFQATAHATALAAALLLAAASPAHAALSATLYPGLGYDLVETSPGSYMAVGYMYPSLSYPLPNSSTGGNAAAKGMGLGAARLSTGTAFMGQRGVVIKPTGSYALGTLGVNTVPGWTPQGYGSSSAQAGNNSGLIAGTSGLYSDDGTLDLGGRAVYYAPGSSTPVQLALPAGFTDPTGFGIGGASNISSTGVIIGFATEYQGSRSVGTRALRWNDTSSEAEVLDRLPGKSAWGDNTSWAVAVNASGTAVGVGNTYTPAGALRGTLAVRWPAGTTAATPLRPLGTSIDRQFSSRAVAVNDAGAVVGSSAKYAANHLPLGDAAVRWAAGSVKPTELGGLGAASDGQSWSYAIAINNAGTVLGLSQKFDPAGSSLGQRAVRWAADSTEPVELGLLSQGSQGQSHTFAFGMNAAGLAVGEANILGSTSNDFSNPAALAVHAVVWTAQGKAIDLNSLLPSNSGWTLYGAYAISDTGLVTGIGYYQPPGFPANFAYPRLYALQLRNGG